MKKLDTEYFIEKSNQIHDNKYDYSLCIYSASKDKVKIVCKKHGIFEQTPDSHLHGHGCFTCSVERTKIGKLKKLFAFIESANTIHGNKFDYSNVVYGGSHKKVLIICKIHGIFEQTPDSHLRGRGCPRCVNRNKTTEIFIDESNLIHDYKYNYSLTNYINPHEKVCIICPLHGKFTQIPNSHLRGSGCPSCNSSKGEIKISIFLKQNNIQFIREKKFVDCKNKYCLPFDFYLPKNNILIEYDGIQHRKPVKFYGISAETANEKFNKTLQNDKIKNYFAKNNSIKLIRISCDVDEINDYLKNYLDELL